MTILPVRIASAGELLVEFVRTDNAPDHSYAGHYEGPYPSGAPGIFISQAAMMGADCSFIGAVGNDAFASVVRDRLLADGVNCDLVVTQPTLPTGTAFVCYQQDGSRRFVFNIEHSAASRLGTVESLIKRMSLIRPNVFHVSGSSLSISGADKTILALCRALTEIGTRISFDPNVRSELLGQIRYRETIEQLMSLSTYFLPSDDDIAVLFPGQHLDEVTAALFEKGNEYVVLKSGKAGSRAISAHGHDVSLPAFSVDMVDPTGAGDCFCAAFVTMIEQSSADIEQALKFANAAGALSVVKRGPMSGNSTYADIQMFLGALAV